jgi:L-fuconolactonase
VASQQQSTGSIRVVDTHVHVWDYRAPWMRWLVDRPAHWDVVRRDFCWADLERELDEADVAELILVQACPDPQETRELLDLASRHDRILGVVGWTTLQSARDTEQQLTSFEGPGSEKLVGIRNNHQWAPDGDVLATPRALASCRLLAERHLPLDIHVPDYRDLPMVARLVQKAPEGTYVIDHLGKPALDSAEAFGPWAESMSLLSTFPNVFVKYSGWATFVRRTLAADVRRYIEVVLERFGPGRVMFGSNWPVALVAGNYSSTYRASLEAIEHLSRPHLEDILHRTALRCYLPDQQAARRAPAAPTPSCGQPVAPS